MENLLLEFINTMHRVLNQRLQQMGAATGMANLTIHQLNYLEAIGAAGETTITEIAGRMQVTKASVTAGVNKLVQMGYAVKTQSPLDKRVYHVRLTAAGERLTGAKQQALAEYGAFIRSALTSAEAGQLAAILSKLVDHFKTREQ